jgi:hypothetical protein
MVKIHAVLCYNDMSHLVNTIRIYVGRINYIDKTTQYKFRTTNVNAQRNDINTYRRIINVKLVS